MGKFADIAHRLSAQYAQADRAKGAAARVRTDLQIEEAKRHAALMATFDIALNSLKELLEDLSAANIGATISDARAQSTEEAYSSRVVRLDDGRDVEMMVYATFPDEWIIGFGRYPAIKIGSQTSIVACASNRWSPQAMIVHGEFNGATTADEIDRLIRQAITNG